MKDEIKESSNSLSRAQVAIATNKNYKKKHSCICYLQTNNRFAYKDAYPLPKIKNLVHKIGNYKVLSALDLKSAHH